ncbi:MAG: hypothetical protein WC755_03215 [Candidatus Woesearchaeota archaeon]|jgi:hypothetical protein
MKDNTKLGIGIAITGTSTFLLYCGIDSFSDVSKGVSQLNDSITNLKDYVANTNSIAIEHTKALIGTAHNYLTSHAHIFSHSPSADTLDSVLKGIDATNKEQITKEIIPAIEKVKKSYSNSGNCPLVKLILPGIITFISGAYTILRADYNYTKRHLYKQNKLQ